MHGDVVVGLSHEFVDYPKGACINMHFYSPIKFILHFHFLLLVSLFYNTLLAFYRWAKEGQEQFVKKEIEIKVQCL